MITIESDNGWFRAVLDDDEDGVSVAIWRKKLGEALLWKPIGRDVIDCPFHVACDRVTEQLNKLVPHAEAWPVPPSGRVVIVPGMW